MSNNTTISATYKFEEAGDGLKKLTESADAVRKVMKDTLVQAERTNSSLSKIFQAINIRAINDSFSRLQSGMKSLTDAYAAQEQAETQLETVMRQRMSATEEQIQSIKDLCSAQQEIGVIGDEVQLAGAQQVATFLKEKSSLETLIPAMNNLIAQQKGLNASGTDAVSVANLMGKAMQGQISALKRVGITFTEAQGQVMQYGTESERAAMLAQIITDNVGQMNAELAKTDSGKQKQLDNSLGDIKEKIGSLVGGALPFVTIAAQSTAAVTSVVTLSKAFISLTKTIVLSTVAFLKNKAALWATAAAQKIVHAWTVAWTAVQKVLNLVLTSNPVGALVVAIAALVAGLIYAYKHSDAFRRICDSVWQSVKPLAKAIMNGLAKAFEWLAEKCEIAWKWLKGILGLGGKKVEVEVDATVSDRKAAPSLEDLEDKYEGYTATSKGSKGTKAPKTSGKSSETAVWTEEAKSVKELSDNITILTERKQNLYDRNEIAKINAQIDALTELRDSLDNVGREKDESNDPVWTEEAQSLRQLNDNIAVLNTELDDCTDPARQAEINKQIDSFNEQAEAIRNVGRAAGDSSAKFNAQAKTLAEVEGNITYYNNLLQNSDADGAPAIRKSIKFWQDKADAIRGAGEEAKATFGTFKDGYSAVKGIGSGVKSLSSALSENTGLWQRITALVDGFISIYEGIAKIVDVINLMTEATKAHATAKTVEATSTTVSTTATVADTVATEAQITADSTESVVAATKSGAKLPFPANIAAIAAGVAAVVAALSMAGAFASGGIVGGSSTSGDRLVARVNSGEMILNRSQQRRLFDLANGAQFALPRVNAPVGLPEVRIPLERLAAAVSPAQQTSEVEFKIKGEYLVGLCNKVTSKKYRVNG